MADADPATLPEAADEVSAPERISQQPEPEAAKPRRWGRIALMAAVPLAMLIAGGLYWLSLQGKVSTDNAYVQQDRVAVSAEVGGQIVEVAVEDGQRVAAGALLFRIDPEPYRLQIAQANATIAQAQANVTALSNSSDLSGASVSAAREDIAFAETNFARKDELYNRGFLTKTEHDAAEHAVQQAREELRIALALQAEARAKLARGAAVPGKNPQIAAGEAQRAAAELNLRRTEVRAPAAGVISQADRLQIGQQVMQGLPVVTIVREASSYVEANFKETELDDMRVGQPAEIRVDAYPDLVLKGHVSSIGAGTGSEFSVLPAQNATGNWVKVTQRVPVRIKIDDDSPRQLIAGLSTEVTVFTDGRER
ncbi:HlyD family secretion protein [Altererythrobacter sp. C41]|uniref:HlyD family secretion protein n=1 Tax=Altererythrobacter sp. C41 TaxID=2806021 RepID=UPI001934468E|nr:HlyD family secretion protein [Altererythrobacter sp. C41]MBM0169212.1 HlyD family secretion protein [Altererythrobacter sp. C41]